MVGRVPVISSWEKIQSFRLIERPAKEGERCRCGRRFRLGETCRSWPILPESVREILREPGFCSVTCARAFLLEALVLEGELRPLAASPRDSSVETALRLLLGVIDLEQVAGPRPY